jgi:hypothetical protein
MSPSPFSFWEQTQLTLLRFLSIVLGLFDHLLHVHWGEHLLDRMSKRWQTRLDQLDEALAHLEEERRRLRLQAEALAIHTATLYLGGRSLARDELRFDPDVPGDEELLDASIALLVKQRLAAIQSVELDPGHFVYDLEPDWAAIYGHLDKAADQAEPEIAEWLREGMRFINENVMFGADAQIELPPSTQHLE